MNLSIGDKVFYSGKLCKVTRNPDNGDYVIRQVLINNELGREMMIHPSEIDMLYTRECIDCCKDVLPDAERGRCIDCLDELNKNSCCDCGKIITPSEGYYAVPEMRCADCGEIAYSKFHGGFTL